MTPLVSILIPLYNEEKNIAHTLKTVIEQPYDNIEIIVVDDHSTDNSVDIVKNLNNDKIKLFTNPKKGGQSARNYAFSQSKGKYVKFLDADDWCTKGMIKKQVTLLENFDGGGGIMFAYPLLKYIAPMEQMSIPQIISVTNTNQEQNY